MHTMPRLIAGALAVVMTAAGTALALAPAALAHPEPIASGTGFVRVSHVPQAQPTRVAVADAHRDVRFLARV